MKAHGLAGELFSEGIPRPTSRLTRKYFPIGMYTGLYMPAIAIDSGIPDDTVHQIRKAYKEVKEEPDIGIIEKRYDGSIPVQLDNNPPYLGVTEFGAYHGRNGPDIGARRIGINRKVKGKQAKRVTKHELRHAKSESLLKYMDVTDHMRTLIMESYAEFGGMKAARHEKPEIIFTTPYTPAIKFGITADKFYKSDIDGAEGYAAFIRDIQKNKSARYTLLQLGRNIKEAMNNGIDPVKATERQYKKEVAEAKKEYKQAA
ncbi:MAG: hypothetical protein QMD97_04635 [Candidatus Aenigmarchaeota archaeon]|nr:hypothetical protein [Candidatus Aenigmarchaeota archaeon]